MKNLSRDPDIHTIQGSPLQLQKKKWFLECRVSAYLRSDNA
jgi:hypothetical protein